MWECMRPISSEFLHFVFWPTRPPGVGNRNTGFFSPFGLGQPLALREIPGGKQKTTNSLIETEKRETPFSSVLLPSLDLYGFLGLLGFPGFLGYSPRRLVVRTMPQKAGIPSLDPCTVGITGASSIIVYNPFFISLKIPEISPIWPQVTKIIELHCLAPDNFLGSGANPQDPWSKSPFSKFLIISHVPPHVSPTH